MNLRIVLAAWLAGLAALSAAAQTTAPAAEESGDPLLARARRFVEQSDRYLHHSKLHRGMKGYGLTVMAGTKVERFDVEIVSLMANWDPHNDVILARLSGLGLDKTGLIAGMSGSPVFVRDADGKDKLIGAVAYGWRAQKEAQCGIQPITQMLTVKGMLPEAPDGEAPTTKPAPATRGSPPATESAAVEGGPAGVSAAPGRLDGGAPISADPAWSSGRIEPPAQYLAAVLDPRKIDFSTFGWPGAPEGEKPDPADMAPRLTPLATPLMVSGVSATVLARAGGALRQAGIVPLQSGGAGPMGPADLAEARLVPGGGISVPLVTGDADLSAVGTVTDIIGDKVLAFGHPFLSQGDVQFPMGPAYIHTVVSGVIESFKLGSTLKTTGSLNHDEGTGIAGAIGGKAAMIPLTVSVDYAGASPRVFRYNVCRNYMLTPMLAGMLIREASTSRHDLPEFHTVRHRVQIDFGKLGRYTAQNTFSGRDVMPVVSDTMRPIAAMLSNPLGPAPAIEKIDVAIKVEPTDVSAQIVDLKLDGRVYRPGETIGGNVVVRPFRKARQNIPIKLDLPADLPDGQYTILACDFLDSLERLRAEKPQLFEPRTTEELFEAIQRVVGPQATSLYLRLPLNRGGIALGQRELPDLPDSKAAVLAEAGIVDTQRFTESLVVSVPSPFVLSGQAQASFEVQKHPKKTILREPTEQSFFKLDYPQPLPAAMLLAKTSPGQKRNDK